MGGGDGFAGRTPDVVGMGFGVARGCVDSAVPLLPALAEELWRASCAAYATPTTAMALAATAKTWRFITIS
jgi:hypothetical protein